MKKTLTLLLAAVTTSISGQTISDFQFNDLDTDVRNAANSITTGSRIGANWTSDFAGNSSVSGGLLTITGQGDTRSSHSGASVSNGELWLVVEGVTWTFDGATATDTISFGFGNNGAANQEIAQILISRDATKSYLSGTTPLTAGTSISQTEIGSGLSSGSAFDFVLHFDWDNNNAYEVLYRTSGVGSYTSIGSAAANPEVDSNKMRYINIQTEAFFSAGDTTSIDRIYISDTAPIPEPSSYALLSGILALSWIMVRRRK